MSVIVSIKSSLGICYIKSTDGRFTSQRNRAYLFHQPDVAMDCAKIGMKRSIDVAVQHGMKGNTLIVKGMIVSLIAVK